MLLLLRRVARLLRIAAKIGRLKPAVTTQDVCRKIKCDLCRLPHGPPHLPVQSCLTTSVALSGFLSSCLSKQASFIVATVNASVPYSGLIRFRLHTLTPDKFRYRTVVWRRRLNFCWCLSSFRKLLYEFRLWTLA